MSKLYPTCRSVNKSLLTAVLSFFLLTFVSIGFAQSPSNILVTGATPANFTMQQFGTIGTGTASAPDYCQTPANQSRPECQGSITNTYTNTYTNNSVPSYCANAANANRPECQTGYTQTTQTQIQPIQTTQVVNNQTTNGQVPSYCQTPANTTASPPANMPQCESS